MAFWRDAKSWQNFVCKCAKSFKPLFFFSHFCQKKNLKSIFQLLGLFDQIRSAWERSHCKGLVLFINLFMFYFDLEFLKGDKFYCCLVQISLYSHPSSEDGLNTILSSLLFASDLFSDNKKKSAKELPAPKLSSVPFGIPQTMLGGRLLNRLQRFWLFLEN